MPLGSNSGFNNYTDPSLNSAPGYEYAYTTSVAASPPIATSFMTVAPTDAGSSSPLPSGPNGVPADNSPGVGDGWGSPGDNASENSYPIPQVNEGSKLRSGIVMAIGALAAFCFV